MKKFLLYLAIATIPLYLLIGVIFAMMVETYSPESQLIPPTEELICTTEWFVTDEKPSQFSDETYPPVETEDTIVTEATEATESTENTFVFNEENWHDEAVFIAKTVWGEARGCPLNEQEKVVWCILNRVDSPDFPNTIVEVVVAPNQFHGYSYSNPCLDLQYRLALDVIMRWQMEKNGEESNRNLAKDYYYFSSNGAGGNTFRKHW